MDLSSFLRILNLEWLDESLKANGIADIETLQQLSADAVEFQLLCPNVTDRLKIRRQLKESIIVSDTNSTGTTDELSDEQTSSLFSAVQNTQQNVDFDGKNTSIIIVDSEIRPGSSSAPTEQAVLVVNEVSKRPKLFDLRSILEETIIGRAILAIYQTKHQLDTKTQGYLCEIIICHFLNQEPAFKLSNNEFELIAREIVGVFPNEVSAVYYIPPIRKRFSRDHKAGISRGKLVDKYRNKLTFLRKAGLLGSSKSTDLEGSLLGSEDGGENQAGSDCDDNEDVTWLKHNTEPWEEVVDKWEKTYTYRETLLNKDLELKEILENFPLIRNSCGYALIAKDFKKKFPESSEKIFSNFAIVFDQLLANRRDTLNQSDHLLLEILESGNINTDSRHYLMLNLICSLLPQRITCKRKKTNWQPTSQEVRDGVIVQAKIPADILTIIEKRKLFFEKQGLPLLPVIIIEGPSYMDIRNIHVSFNDIMYKAASVLKAIDICFTLTHVLNLKYPCESEHIWMFIQLAVYKLKTKYDNIPTIIDIVQKVNLKLQ